MTVDKYIFWSNIQNVVSKLDDLAKYKECNWFRNLSFKEDLNDDIKIFDNLLGVGVKMDLKPIKPIKKELDLK